MGLIVANLDCEVHWARQRTPGPHKGLPRPVQLAIAKASRVLAVFARPGDRLWTLADEPVRVADEREVLAWGQVDPSMPLPYAADTSRSWQEDLWHLRAEHGAAARCNDRRFARDLLLDSEWSLPEIRTLTSMAELEDYLRSAALGPGDAWVAKAPFSASGRERMRRHGRVLEGEELVRTGRLMQRYGALVIEPWMPRIADYGCAGLVYEDRRDLRIFPPHALESDGTGVFRSVRIADTEVSAKLGMSFSQALQHTTEQAGQALHSAGYRGPFGIDAFTYSDHRGHRRLQTLSEINARLSFGLVARALAEQAQQADFEFRI